VPPVRARHKKVIISVPVFITFPMYIMGDRLINVNPERPRRIWAKWPILGKKARKRESKRVRVLPPGSNPYR
jgi:hypothetical protein